MTTGFDELFVAEYPKLVALGVSVCGDRELARELAQETLVRAHERWDRVQHYDSPEAWLRRVMSNLLIDQFRSSRSERSALARLAGRPTADVDAPATARWAELVAPLTPLQRVVATLFYADDLSVDEIARILDIAPGTVKSTLSKVRRRLRREAEGGAA